MDKDLIETRADGVATLTLNRPDRLNALSAPIMEGLLEALPRLAGDPSIGAIVLTGAGRAFCAGGDVKRMAEETVPRSSAKRTWPGCAAAWKSRGCCTKSRSPPSRW